MMPEELKMYWEEFWGSLPVFLKILCSKNLLQAAFIAGATAGAKILNSMILRVPVKDVPYPEVKPSNREFKMYNEGMHHE
jgi:hypothetical protein